MRYAYPRLSRWDFYIVRLFGPGLGNLLFPWGRAVVEARRHGLVMIAPTWPQLKVGPFLRRERDKRTYHNLFQNSEQCIGGFRKMAVLASIPKLSEAMLPSAMRNDRPDCIFVFEGMQNYFERILLEHEFVRKCLIEITKPEHQSGLRFDFRGSICAHVRLGDFAAPTDGASRSNTRVPLQWYVEVATEIRRRVSGELNLYVFSDGSDDELAEILSLPRTRRLDFGSSIADLLALSRSSSLIASNSTFSMWASYLGRMPVVWPKGALKQRLYYDRPNAEIESSSLGDIPSTFAHELISRVAEKGF